MGPKNTSSHFRLRLHICGYFYKHSFSLVLIPVHTHVRWRFLKTPVGLYWCEQDEHEFDANVSTCVAVLALPRLPADVLLPPPDFIFRCSEFYLAGCPNIEIHFVLLHLPFFILFFRSLKKAPITHAHNVLLWCLTDAASPGVNGAERRSLNLFLLQLSVSTGAQDGQKHHRSVEGMK